ncbi:MAG TPA: transketolase [Firmicutes bacterium]|jgi:transketolase|nr:transketolase [Bacillota bacterium]
MAEKIATRDAYGKALVALGAKNKDVVVLDADLSKSTKTAKFGETYPERFFQMGIAEQDLMSTAAGLATVGKIPFASTFAIFATGRAFEQIRNSIAYPHLNVKVAATHAGITVGEDGGSHQSIEDIALMRVLPGMTVIVPADGPEAEQAVYAAAEHDGPVYLRFGRGGVPVIHGADYQFKIGKAEVLRDGGDVAIIACGVMVEAALAAADMLAAEGIAARVINMATVKPLDEGAVKAAATQVGAIVTAEEHSVIGGLGAAVAEYVVGNCPVPVEMVGVQDVFGQSGNPAELLKEYGLTAADIVAAAKRAVERKKQ